MNLHCGDALDAYECWPSPVTLISDGAYGVEGFPGDPSSPSGLLAWYRPHVEAWSRYATPLTTLWFWNTEIGWATVHPLLAQFGWEYVACNVWDKGLAHVAGNVNSKTIRRYPVATEVCVQYVKAARCSYHGQSVTLQAWLRLEWQRSGLPLDEANRACGVKNAATRKYLTTCHRWYFPPPPVFELLVKHANDHGHPAGRPYFSLDGERPATAGDWSRMRSRFSLVEQGTTNVWREPSVRGATRLHPNQKPERLIERCVLASTEVGDVVWEPFGGACTAAVVAKRHNRVPYAAEADLAFAAVARRRLEANGV